MIYNQSLFVTRDSHSIPLPFPACIRTLELQCLALSAHGFRPAASGFPLSARFAGSSGTTAAGLG